MIGRVLSLKLLVIAAYVMLAGCYFRAPLKDPEAEALVNRVVNEAFATWNAEALYRSTNATFRSTTTLNQQKKMFHLLSGLEGRFVRVNRMHGDTQWVYFPQTGRIKVATYQVSLEYANGPMNLIIQLTKRGDTWGVGAYNIDMGKSQ